MNALSHCSTTILSKRAAKLKISCYMKKSVPFTETSITCTLSCRRYLDWIGLMTYDMEFSQMGVTKHQSPLFSRPDEPAGDKQLCIVSMCIQWSMQSIRSYVLRQIANRHLISQYVDII